MIQKELKELENKANLTLHDLTLPNFAKHQAADPVISARLKKWHLLNKLTTPQQEKLFRREKTKDPKCPTAEPRPGKSEVLLKGHVVDHDVLFGCYRRDHRKLVVPATLTDSVLRHFHGLPVHGHMGVSKTYTYLAINQAFTWRGMRRQLRLFIGACRLCAKRKPTRPLKANTTRPIVATRP